MEQQIARLSVTNLKLEKQNASQKITIDTKQAEVDKKEIEIKKITNTLIDQLKLEKDILES